MSPLVCPLWSESWIISHVVQPFPASAFTLTPAGGAESRETSILPRQRVAVVNQHSLSHPDGRRIHFPPHLLDFTIRKIWTQIQTLIFFYYYFIWNVISTNLYLLCFSFRSFVRLCLCADAFHWSVGNWELINGVLQQPQTHVLGCRSPFQCVFCLTAGVSTSSTWIEEGQPGGVCPVVIQERNLGAPWRWGWLGKRRWERGRKKIKTSPLSSFMKPAGSFKFPQSAFYLFIAIKCLQVHEQLHISNK